MAKLKTEKKSPTLPKVRSLPAAIRFESEGTSSVKLEEWCFLEKGHYHCRESEKLYLLSYELSREAYAIGLVYPHAAAWRTVFEGYFPETPFLAIPAKTRQERTEAAFFPPPGAVPLADPMTGQNGLTYTCRYLLKPDFQYDLEAFEEETKEKLGEKSAELALAISGFYQDLPAEAFDQSAVYVEMTIDFDYSNTLLMQAFNELLRGLRRTRAMPTKKNEIDAHLKILAATRLYRFFGTVNKAQMHLASCGMDLPYQNDAGWTQARNKVREMLGVTPEAQASI